jgi:hypothetical protein
MPRESSGRSGDTTRRSILASGATGVTGGVAGCGSSGRETSAASEPATSETNAQTRASTPAATETPAGNPSQPVVARPGEVQETIDAHEGEPYTVVNLLPETVYELDSTIHVKDGVVLNCQFAHFEPTKDVDLFYIYRNGHVFHPMVDLDAMEEYTSAAFTLDPDFSGFYGPGRSRNRIVGGETRGNGTGTAIRIHQDGSASVSACSFQRFYHDSREVGTAIEIASLGGGKGWLNGNEFYGAHVHFSDAAVHTHGDDAINANKFEIHVQPKEDVSKNAWLLERGGRNEYRGMIWDAWRFTDAVIRIEPTAGSNNRVFCRDQAARDVVDNKGDPTNGVVVNKDITTGRGDDYLTALGNAAYGSSLATAIGGGSLAIERGGTALGASAYAEENCLSVGTGASAGGDSAVAIGPGATIETDRGVRFGGDQVELKAAPETFANGDIETNGLVLDLDGEELRVRARTPDGTVRAGTLTLDETLDVASETEAAGAPSLSGQAPASAYDVPYHPLTIDGDVSELEGVPGLDIESDFAVFNGEPNATGSVWLCWDREHLYLAGDISDDEHVNPHLGDRSWRGDGFQFGIAPAGGKKGDQFREINVALGPTGPRAYTGTQPTDDVPYKRVMAEVDAEIERIEDEQRTVYEIAVPWDSLPVAPDDRTFCCSIGFNDRDEGTDYQLREWASGIYGGKNAGQFRTCALQTD